MAEQDRLLTDEQVGSFTAGAQVISDGKRDIILTIKTTEMLKAQDAKTARILTEQHKAEMKRLIDRLEDLDAVTIRINLSVIEAIRQEFIGE